MSNTNVIWIAVVVAAAVIFAAVVVGVALAAHARKRRVMLKERFGSEYDRAHAELGRRADKLLARRIRRIERLRIRALSDDERARFSSAWTRIQAQFVDDPRGASAGANDLIKEVMRARGYSTDEEFDERVRDLAVDHPEVVQHYRAARELALSPTPPSTEDFRQALVHYRVMFNDLLAPAAQAEAVASRTLRERPA